MHDFIPTFTYRQELLIKFKNKIPHTISHGLDRYQIVRDSNKNTIVKAVNWTKPGYIVISDDKGNTAIEAELLESLMSAPNETPALGFGNSVYFSSHIYKRPPTETSFNRRSNLKNGIHIKYLLFLIDYIKDFKTGEILYKNSDIVINNSFIKLNKPTIL